DVQGGEQASMGVECVDFDNDGRLDFYQTSYAKELATLHRNLGDGLFADVTLLTGAGTGTFAYVTWGTGLVDFDNDGDRDIFVATGHVQDNIERYDNAATSATPNVLLLNQGEGTFVDVSERSGDGMQAIGRSRGAAFDDLDNDGDVDVVVLNARAAPTLLRNESSEQGHWLQVGLRGVRTNRDGVGARVTVVAGDLVQTAEVHSGRGYQSHYGMRLHFGLGTHRRVDRIEVRWIGGGVDICRDVEADQLFVLTEGDCKSPASGGSNGR
ncbi:MAG: CRTAC1 family protein, partial [Planctomycetes bacterium]|nr:CRTAC1 family protein [Planctomycetota bacterium]